MASGYTADINVRVKGATDLNRLNRLLGNTSRKIDAFNKKQTLALSGGKANAALKTQVYSLNALDKNLGKAAANFKKVSLENGQATKAAREYAKALDQVNRAQLTKNKLLNEANKKLAHERFASGDVSGRSQYGSPIGPRPAGGGGGRGGGSSIAQSAIISGAFPLLFGQGPLTAAAGAIGGGVGAKVGGQMGGFAGGLAATAAVTAIQQAIAGVSKLGQAMNGLTADIGALTASMGQAGTLEGARLKVIEQVRGKQAALNAAMRNMSDIIGQKGVEDLKKWGEASKALSANWSRFMLRMGAGFAKLLNWADKFLGISKGAKQGERIDFARSSTDPKIAKLVEELKGLSSMNRGDRRRRKEINTELFGEKGEGGLVGKAIEIKDQEKLKELYGDLLDSKLKEQELLKARIAGNYEEVKLNFDIAEEIKRQENSVGKIAEKQKEKIESTMRENNNLKEQYELTKKIEDAWKSITAEITGSIKDGIKGLIKGTATWADMLNNIADKFLDMALNQALYGNIMGEFTKGSGIFGKIFGFANGGSPPVGKPSIVGEKGPELFVPSSSGKIVPNHELGGGGSVNVTVNVDASGTDVQGDDSQAKQLGTMLSAAVQAELVKQKRPGGLLAGVA